MGLGWDDRHMSDSVDIVFIPTNGAQVRTTALVAEQLVQLGLSVLFVTIESQWRDLGATRELQSRPYPFCDYETFRERMISPKVMVVLNDWNKFIIDVLAEAREAGITTIGYVEAAKNYARGPYYVHVDKVLAIGQFDMEHLTGEVELVGSPHLDQRLTEAVSFPDTALVAINLKVYEEPARGSWLDSATWACRRLELPWLITQHPFDPVRLEREHMTDEPLTDLIRRSTLLISPHSTVILEAMALGKPAVYLRPMEDPAHSFDDTMGGLQIVDTREALCDALEVALTWTDNYRERSARFFNYHVSVNPKLPAAVRAAAAIARIAAG